MSVWLWIPNYWASVWHYLCGLWHVYIEYKYLSVVTWHLMIVRWKPAQLRIVWESSLSTKQVFYLQESSGAAVCPCNGILSFVPLGYKWQERVQKTVHDEFPGVSDYSENSKGIWIESAPGWP